jgi:hypothetical protein
MTSTPPPPPTVVTQCVTKSLQDCQTYRCQVGATVGSNLNNLGQAQHICSMFPRIEGCVAEQACSAYFPTSTSMNKSCSQTVKCIQNGMDTK